MTGMDGVLAHQGGWDEGLMVAGALILVYGIGWLVRSRRERRNGRPGEPRLDHRTRLEQRRRVDEHLRQDRSEG